jgi:hypothetical protein
VVLQRIYAKCVDGQADIAKRRIAEALRPALTEEQQLIADELGAVMNQLDLDAVRHLVATARKQADPGHGTSVDKKEEGPRQ